MSRRIRSSRLRPGARARLRWRCQFAPLCDAEMTTPSLDRQIAQLARVQYGLFSRKQLQEMGVGRGVIDHRMSTGRWELLVRGVFRLKGVPSSWRQSLYAATLYWGSSSAVSHRASAALRGLAGFESQLVEVTVPKNRRGGKVGIVHRHRLDPTDVEKLDGLPVTTVARTLIDLASLSRREKVEEALDDALSRGLVSIPYLRVRLAEMSGSAGRPGIGTMRALIDARAGSRVPQNVFETRMLRVIKRAGLPPPEIQFPVYEANDRIAIVDFAYPEQRLAIETDGYRWHSGKVRWQKDLRRRNRLLAVDWRMMHVTWDQLRETPASVTDSIRRLLAMSVRPRM